MTKSELESKGYVDYGHVYFYFLRKDEIVESEGTLYKYDGIGQYILSNTGDNPYLKGCLFECAPVEFVVYEKNDILWMRESNIGFARTLLDTDHNDLDTETSTRAFSIMSRIIRALREVRACGRLTDTAFESICDDLHILYYGYAEPYARIMDTTITIDDLYNNLAMTYPDIARMVSKVALFQHAYDMSKISEETLNRAVSYYR